MIQSVISLRSVCTAVCALAVLLAVTSTCEAQSSASDVPAAASPVAKPIDPMAWIAAAQDLRIAAQAAEQIIDKFGKTIEQTMLHVAQASHGFDPLGLKAAMVIIGDQNDVIRQQSETIRIDGIRDSTTETRKSAAETCVTQSERRSPVIASASAAAPFRATRSPLSTTGSNFAPTDRSANGPIPSNRAA